MLTSGVIGYLKHLDLDVIDAEKIVIYNLIIRMEEIGNFHISILVTVLGDTLKTIAMVIYVYCVVNVTEWMAHVDD